MHFSYLGFTRFDLIDLEIEVGANAVRATARSFSGKVFARECREAQLDACPVLS